MGEMNRSQGDRHVSDLWLQSLQEMRAGSRKRRVCRVQEAVLRLYVQAGG